MASNDINKIVLQIVLDELSQKGDFGERDRVLELQAVTARHPSEALGTFSHDTSVISGKQRNT